MTRLDTSHDVTGQDSARASIRKHSKSFALAARLLAPEARRRAEALYAWCRRADDAVDCAPDAESAAVALAELRRELDAIYAAGGGVAVGDPAAVSFRAVALGCGIPREYPAELLDGFGMDVGGFEYRTEGDLLLYCYRAAGVVGLMMCHALGVGDAGAFRHASDLGTAMQLTNIARDVAEDHARGRRYLPAAWFDAAPPVGAPLDDAAFAPAVRRCLALAGAYYESGNAGLVYLDRRSRFAVRVASLVYAEIGRRVAANGHRVTAGRARVSGRRKLLLVARAALG